MHFASTKHMNILLVNRQSASTRAPAVTTASLFTRQAQKQTLTVMLMSTTCQCLLGFPPKLFLKLTPSLLPGCSQSLVAP